MKDKEDHLVFTIIIIFVLAAVVVMGVFTWLVCREEIKPKPCYCTINYNGTNVSIEDAIELAGEDLTTSQNTSVIVLIKEYCNQSK